MTRILFWLALAFLVTMAIRSKLRSIIRPPSAPDAPRRAASALPAAEAMLCCAQCGIHYPASETLQVKGRDYCCPAHAALS